MTDTVSLTLKIDPALKETLKALALENQTTISYEVSQRLIQSLSTVAEPEVDHTETTEEGAPLTAAELKQIRTLLKKGKKKK
ncbi:hypothetical protein GKQ23_14720 [Erwinia sp. E602]|uniref:hypothetical protein n=1 Tax=unclassified Erwinia TaxID=2622719 RepID=UPI0006FB5285|nr:MULTISPECIES: hypothetical protein [unclassified Erwinia]KQN62911.1 hypothetical protein ASF13_21385 [Erwinia sp. Leaf53]PLV51334.1 hypothetical protein NV64_19830 [Erwinia sp. B116]QUG76175.1 hypothetical protein GKQ23_14720 [Erwinia sp. E602]